ncbi:MAG: phosphate ABC transporter ATP-binding protein [Candidatus Promineifilaceae bacterium]|nr:phosphate ABC transporter ATP-binding protein [Candidatus Promineifilaceae bacterium]
MPPPTRPLYYLRNLQQAYDGRTVLAVDHLTIYRGEILALVGPSGAGKSTLLRLLNFLERPAAGEMQFDGMAIAFPPPLATLRRVTTVFQEPRLLNRTVAANVAFGLRVRGRAPASAAVERWLVRLGLAGLGGRKVRSLSAGEAQRVALARALAIRPDVLLLDEPTSNLDPYNVGLIEDVIRDANENEGTSVVLVTHDIFQARRLAHRTGLLLSGRLVEVGETEPFFERPARAETAAFLRGELVY